jgi:hypothetical protein
VCTCQACLAKFTLVRGLAMDWIQFYAHVYIGPFNHLKFVQLSKTLLGIVIIMCEELNSGSSQIKFENKLKWATMGEVAWSTRGNLWSRKLNCNKGIKVQRRGEGLFCNLTTIGRN